MNRLLNAAILAALVTAPTVLATNKVAAAWYAGWHALDFPLSNFAWDKYTHATYAFA
jgi:hypothetical protein